MACNYCGVCFAALVAPPSASGKDLNSVDFPDSRIQHLNYLPIDLDGYVGEVTDEGSAVYPEAIPCCRILSMGELDNWTIGHALLSGMDAPPREKPFRPCPAPQKWLEPWGTGGGK